MTDLLSILSFALTSASLTYSVGKLLAKFVRKVRRRKHTRFWRPFVHLTQQVLDVFDATQADVVRVTNDADAALGRAHDGLGELRHDLRDWTFKVFVMDALRGLNLPPTLQVPVDSPSEPPAESGEEVDG